MSKEEQELMQYAANEIRMLRNQNNILSARLDMFDKCMLLLHTSPSYSSTGKSEDLAWRIEEYLSNQPAADIPA